MGVTCDTCQKTFTMQSSLRRHMREVHGVLNVGDRPSDVDKPSVMCAACQKRFTAQSSLNRHMREVHNVVSVGDRPSAVDKPTVLCSTCQKEFTTQSLLDRHMRGVHNMPTDSNNSKPKYTCQETNCNNSYRKNKELICHLEQEHNKIFENEIKTFANVVEFKNWKHGIEQELHCMYVVAAHRKGKVAYYNCNRTKTGRESKWTGKRRIKSKGSSKLNFGCTSQIKVTYDKGETNEVTVFWQKTHYAHKMELEHLRLSTQDREDVAMKLINGIPKHKILDQARDEITQGKMKRKCLITNKDISNIVHSYKIDILHMNDAISIDEWVQDEEEMESLVSLTNCENKNECVKEKLRECMKQTFEILEKNMPHLDDATVSKIIKHLGVVKNLANSSRLENKSNIRSLPMK